VTGPVRARRDAGIDVLTLDSPANRNALSVAALETLLAGVAASAKGSSRALLIDHAGPVFCAGVDLRERRALPAGAPTHSALLARLLTALWRYPKPVLCRVGGTVRGGGLGLVACADIVVASSRADFAYSEVRVGVAPALVAMVAAAKVPLGSLLPWLLTGTVFDARIARRLGLVTRIDTSVDADLAALRRAAPGAMREMKRLAREQQATDIERVIARMTTVSSELFDSAEAREGMAAFAERRPPAWALER
jgi:enoyl-CoA hydratase/carnithine racemase